MPTHQLGSDRSSRPTTRGRFLSLKQLWIAIRRGRRRTRLRKAFLWRNPLHAWHFAQSLNLPQADRADARIPARLGVERRPAPHLPQDLVRAALAELAARHDQIKCMEKQEKNRLTKTAGPMIRADIRASLKGLAARIARFKAKISDHLARHRVACGPRPQGPQVSKVLRPKTDRARACRGAPSFLNV
jgi:hypothetical protein